MMPKPFRQLVLLISCLAVCVSILPAQRLGPAPKRPKVPATLDTNDAYAYHDWAVDVFETDPAGSAAAFYWAARIEPNFARALYGRRAALILSNLKLLNTYMSGSRRRYDSKELRAADSLYLRALMIDPFLYTPLDKRMFTAYLRESALQEARRTGEQLTPELVDFYIVSYLRRADIETRAWVAYSDGVFPRALSLYAEAIKSTKEKAGLRVDRARTFGMLGNADSAIYEFNLALEELRKKDSKNLVALYNSKAVLEHSIGMMLEGDRKISAAREAYGRALQEDLSYYPAHMRLGLLAIDANDTTTALSELDLAAQIAADEPYVHSTYGLALSRFGKTTEAIAELNKAVEQEPLYARPYALLTEILQKKGDKAGALAAANKFLSVASQKDPDRVTITQRRAELSKP